MHVKFKKILAILENSEDRYFNHASYKEDPLTILIRGSFVYIRCKESVKIFTTRNSEATRCQSNRKNIVGFYEIIITRLYYDFK